MPQPVGPYIDEPTNEPGPDAKLGVLIVNLGTPDAPTPSAVRRFLAQFLWDPRVVEAPRWLWWLALHGVILRIRPRRSAHAYQQIWTPQGSPLLLYSRSLVDGVRAEVGTNISVALGMSYGSPSIPSALEQLRKERVRQLLVLPLYPQYSATTTASVFDSITAELQRWRNVPELRFINSYHDEPAYIEALAASIEERWRTHGRAHLLLSFHGIPRKYVLGGDPYERQCAQTANLVAARLKLARDEWTMSFQSQIARQEWLRPYTDETLTRYARQGPKRVTVVCPGFATDCLETLEEIALRNATAFREQGGEFFDYVPALNADPAHAKLLASLVRRHTQGWPQESTAAIAQAPPDQRTARQGVVG